MILCPVHGTVLFYLFVCVFFCLFFVWAVRFLWKKPYLMETTLVTQFNIFKMFCLIIHLLFWKLMNSHTYRYRDRDLEKEREGWCLNFHNLWVETSLKCQIPCYKETLLSFSLSYHILLLFFLLQTLWVNNPKMWFKNSSRTWLLNVTSMNKFDIFFELTSKYVSCLNTCTCLSFSCVFLYLFFKCLNFIVDAFHFI